MAALGALALALLAAPVKLCLVAAVLHVPCPGCGLTRAAFAMARGDFTRAFALHPLSLVLVPALGWIGSVHAFRFVRTGNAWTDSRPSPWSEGFLAAIALLLVAVWIARLFGLFGGPVSI